MGEGRTLGNIGNVYYDLFDYPKALEYHEKSLAIAREIGDKEGEQETLTDTGNAHLALKEYDKAYPIYKEAISIIESIRGNLKNEEFKTGYFQDKTEPYENNITCLYELHRQTPGQGFDRQIFTYAEKSKARGLLDLLTESNADIRQGIDPDLLAEEQKLNREYSRVNSELQKRLSQPEDQRADERITLLKAELKENDDRMEELKNQIIRRNPRYSELKYPAAVTIAEFQQSLPDADTLCIEYKVTAEAVFAWRITKDDFRLFKLDIDKQTLTGKVNELLNTFREIMEEEVSVRRAVELYALLLEPLLYGNRNKLLIIPDGILNYLPFETLVSGDSGLPYDQVSFLIKKYNIYYAQSATVFHNQKKYEKEDHSSAAGLLALGDPVFSGEELLPAYGYIRNALTEDERATFQRLIHSGEEVRNIGRLFNHPSIYLREEATEEKLKLPGLEDYRYVHLAAHGLLNEVNPQFSGIVLTQDDDPLEDGFLLTREIFNLKLNADLVVLSACQTGLGNEVDGEGIVGLSRAWFYAGTSSLVVSLWSVSDYTTSLLMESFYKNIQNGMPYSQALGKAKLELLTGGTYANPYYWAGFVLLGGE